MTRLYGGLLAALAGGIVLALCWALPAASAGGAEYGRALLWSQTADRLVSSFAHAQPWWWYLLAFPAIVYPWSLWPPLWSAVARALRPPHDGGILFCLSWLLPTFALFSFISGKQPQYLLSLLPPFALLSARALAGSPPSGSRPHRFGVGLAMASIGAFLLIVSLYSPFPDLPLWTSGIPPWAGGVVLGAGLLLPLLRIRSGALELKTATAATILLCVVLNLGLVVPASPAQDVSAVGRLIYRLQQEGRSVAHAAKYAGQYHFAGRLRKPLQVISSKRIAEWAEANPGGAVVVYFWERPPAGEASPLLVRPYRGRYVTVWNAEDAVHMPMPARSSSGSSEGS
jgi:4-amino-4-deoxy-L-arabinose transferase-like glycosyltransferase